MMRRRQEKDTVLVVGSANMDMVVSCKRFPKPGETVLAEDFGMYPGGKGANQAVACARLGGKVQFLGKMGRDVFRDRLIENLRQDDVMLDHLLTDKEASTGIALIAVDGGGENQIVVVSGSNMKLMPAELEERHMLFEQAAVVLLQLEIPVPTVERAAEMAKEHGAVVMLNPAPAQPLPESLMRRVDILTPNEREAQVLTGIDVKDEASAERAARALLELGIRHVVVTMGHRGALHVSRDHRALYPARRVEVLDTTAAGDAFNGALAWALANGYELKESIPFANTVAAFAVTRRGAQTSMPTLGELEAFAEAPSHPVALKSDRL